MANDNFVYWISNKKPSKDEIEKVTKQFFSSVLAKMTWDGDRFLVDLIGNYSHPLEGITGARNLYIDPEGTRYLEIVIGKSNIDILTRSADEFTNVCARGLAKIFERFWSGELQD